MSRARDYPADDDQSHGLTCGSDRSMRHSTLVVQATPETATYSPSFPGTGGVLSCPIPAENTQRHRGDYGPHLGNPLRASHQANPSRLAAMNMYDTPTTDHEHLTHEMPCPRCAHSNHTFLPCSETCACESVALPGSAA